MPAAHAKMWAGRSPSGGSAEGVRAQEGRADRRFHWKKAGRGGGKILPAFARLPKAAFSPPAARFFPTGRIPYILAAKPGGFRPGRSGHQSNSEAIL